MLVIQLQKQSSWFEIRNYLTRGKACLSSAFRIPFHTHSRGGLPHRIGLAQKSKSNTEDSHLVPHGTPREKTRWGLQVFQSKHAFTLGASVARDMSFIVTVMNSLLLTEISVTDCLSTSVHGLKALLIAKLEKYRNSF